MIFCVQLNPTLDRILQVPLFTVGETLRIENVTVFPLGKAISVALSAKCIGEPSLVVSPIGENEFDQYEQFLSENGVDHYLIPISGRTRSNITIIDPLSHTTTHLREQGPMLTLDILNSIEEYLENNVKSEDVVLFSGSLPPGLPEDAYARLLSHLPPCKARGLDTSGPALRFGMDGHPTFMKPNLEELGELFSDAPAGPVDPIALVPFIERFRDKEVSLGAITFGEKGSILWNHDTILTAELVIPVVIDTVGCGDAFFAGLAAGSSHGWGLEKIARIATAAAGANALTPGAGIFRAQDFEALKFKVQMQWLKTK
jgi:1-phosphofructokinase family hexose kinase